MLSRTKSYVFYVQYIVTMKSNYGFPKITPGQCYFFYLYKECIINFSAHVSHINWNMENMLSFHAACFTYQITALAFLFMLFFGSFPKKLNY